MALYIIGGILLLLTLLLFVRVRICVDFNESGLAVSLRILPFRVVIYPGKDKKTHAKIEKKKKKTQKRSLAGDFALVKSLLSPAVDILKKVGGYIRCEHINIEYTAAGKDAMSTAMQFGGAYAVVGLVYNALSCVLDVREKTLAVYADFLGETPKIVLSAELSIAVWQIIAIVLLALRFYVQKVKPLMSKQQTT